MMNIIHSDQREALQKLIRSYSEYICQGLKVQWGAICVFEIQASM